LKCKRGRDGNTDTFEKHNLQQNWKFSEGRVETCMLRYASTREALVEDMSFAKL
jgi:hypothetical protein